MRFTEHRVNTDKLYVLCIGDLHIGNKAFDEKVLDGYLAWANENRPYVRIVLMGDLLECATKTSVGKAVYDEVMSTNDQIKYAKAKFSPFADIIAGAVIGNHEERISIATSIDVMETLCDYWRVPYLGYQGIIKWRGNKVAYTQLVWHGATGGTTTGGNVNAVEKMANIAYCDLYTMGHVHKLTTFSRDIKDVDLRNNCIVDKRQVFVTTGSALGWDSSYSEMKGYSIPKKGFPKIRLDMIKGKKDIHCSI